MRSSKAKGWVLPPCVAVLNMSPRRFLKGEPAFVSYYVVVGGSLMCLKERRVGFTADITI